MDNFTGIDTEELGKKVKGRQKFIEEIVKFVEEITFKIGKKTMRSIDSPVERRLDGFRNFSFLAETCLTMFGGNGFNVWYHPEVKKIDTKMTRPVLSVYYHDDLDKCRVEVFSKDSAWQREIKNLMKNKDRILAEMKKVEEDQQEQQLLQAEDAKKRSRVLEETERLKI